MFKWLERGFGPRALGNRTLMKDPRGDKIKDKVNKIKAAEFGRLHGLY